VNNGFACFFVIGLFFNDRALHPLRIADAVDAELGRGWGERCYSIISRKAKKKGF
jgi:hypothetical protein